MGQGSQYRVHRKRSSARVDKAKIQPRGLGGSSAMRAGIDNSYGQGAEEYAGQRLGYGRSASADEGKRMSAYQGSRSPEQRVDEFLQKANDAAFDRVVDGAYGQMVHGAQKVLSNYKSVGGGGRDVEGTEESPSLSTAEEIKERLANRLKAMLEARDKKKDAQSEQTTVPVTAQASEPKAGDSNLGGSSEVESPALSSDEEIQGRLADRLKAILEAREKKKTESEQEGESSGSDQNEPSDVDSGGAVLPGVEGEGSESLDRDSLLRGLTLALPDYLKEGVAVNEEPPPLGVNELLGEEDGVLPDELYDWMLNKTRQMEEARSEELSKDKDQPKVVKKKVFTKEATELLEKMFGVGEYRLVEANDEASQEVANTLSATEKYEALTHDVFNLVLDNLELPEREREFVKKRLEKLWSEVGIVLDTSGELVREGNIAHYSRANNEIVLGQRMVAMLSGSEPLSAEELLKYKETLMHETMHMLQEVLRAPGGLDLQHRGWNELSAELMGQVLLRRESEQKPAYSYPFLIDNTIDTIAESLGVSQEQAVVLLFKASLRDEKAMQALRWLAAEDAHLDPSEKNFMLIGGRKQGKPLVPEHLVELLEANEENLSRSVEHYATHLLDVADSFEGFAAAAEKLAKNEQGIVLFNYIRNNYNWTQPDPNFDPVDTIGKVLFGEKQVDTSLSPRSKMKLELELSEPQSSALGIVTNHLIDQLNLPMMRPGWKDAKTFAAIKDDLTTLTQATSPLLLYMHDTRHLTDEQFFEKYQQRRRSIYEIERAEQLPGHLRQAYTNMNEAKSRIIERVRELHGDEAANFYKTGLLFALPSPFVIEESWKVERKRSADD